MKIERFILFFTTLSVALIIGFIIHFFCSKPAGKSHLWLTYGFNFFMANLFVLLFVWKQKLIKPFLGYFFLYFSLLKFILFIALVQPNIDHTSGIKGPAFFIFFIPYALSLLIEIRFVIRELNPSE